MKKKGFTLIELLAVIVILGIITVIAVPKVLDIINKSKESASSSSIKLVKDAIKTQVAASELTNSAFTKETDGCYLFNFDDQTSGNAKALEIKNKDKVSGSIKYCNNTFTDDTLKFDGNSISKGDTKKAICKRATTLHMDSTHTFGNLGKSGTLSSGDAFDCDVNGDGIYNPETERFYYVTDMDDITAVLIYYNNVSAGNPSNTKNYAYDSSGENWHGPRTAIEQLPTTSQWSNVRLTNNVRPITTNTGGNTTAGGTLPSNFSYAGYAARLLTIQEVKKGTGLSNIPTLQVGELDNFTYLLENTKFANNSNVAWAWWLENSLSDNSVNAWFTYGHGRYVNYNTVSDAVGYAVRPAIEVSKSNIEY